MVGNGLRVTFWKGVWCGDTPLRIAFPSLYALKDSKEAWVRDCWSGCNGGEGWDSSFARFYNDWVVEKVERLLVKLGRYVVVPEVEDRVCGILLGIFFEWGTSELRVECLDLECLN